MNLVMTPVASEQPLVRSDLDAIRAERSDDGRRYELLDGVLLVSPAPKPLHQRTVFRLARVLDDACPPDLEVMIAPLDVVLDDETVLQPDILVARRADFTEHDLSAAPVLAVEVLSPSTRRIDQLLKRARYEAAGAAAFWTIDPDAPSLEAWTLADGAYVRGGSASGTDRFETTDPYPMTVVPADLVAPRRTRPDAT